MQTIIPLAATSEVLFTRFYERLVRRRTDPPAATYLVGFDSLPIRAEKSLYDLAGWARSVPGLAQALLDAHPGDHPSGHEWNERFAAHLAAYGHTVYNLDFANAVPADDPAPLLATLRFYLGGEVGDPYRRQREQAERREAAAAEVLERLDPMRARPFRRLLRWAQRLAPIREDALGDIGLAWPQLRRMLAELGGRLVAAGVLTDADQVYWLTRDELSAAGAAGRQHHHAGLDTAVRAGLGRGHRCRRTAEPQLDRGPGVRDPGRAGHRRGDPPDRQRTVGHRRRRHGDGQSEPPSSSGARLA